MKHFKFATSLAILLTLAGCDVPTDTNTKYDTPKIVISDVTPNGVVTGYATGDPDMTLTINNKTAVLSDSPREIENEHIFSVSGVNTSSEYFNIVALDTRSHTLTQKLANKNKRMQPAVLLRMNTSSLDYLSSELMKTIDAVNLREMLKGDGTPVFTKDVYGFTYDFYTTDNDSDYHMDNAKIIMTPTPSNDSTAQINLYASVENVKMRLVSDNPTVDIDVTITMDKAIVKGTAVIGANGELVVDSKNVTIELVNYNADFAVTDLYSWLASLFAGDTQQAVEDSISEKLDTFMKDDLVALLKEIPFSMKNLEVNGGKLDIDALPSTLSSDSDGFNTQLDGAVKASVIDTDLAAALGSLYVTTPMEYITNATQPFQVSTVLSSNYLNQALLAAYESGATNVTDSYKGYDYVVTPQGPASVKFFKQGETIGEFNLDNLRVDIQSSTINAEIYLNVKVALDKNTIGIEDDHLLVNLSKQQFDIDVIYYKAPGKDPASNTTKALVESAIKIILPAIIPEMTSVFNEVPVPAFSGYGIDLIERFSTATTDGHLALTADIVPISQTAVAPAPATFVDVAAQPSNTASQDGGQNGNDAPVVLEFSGVNPSDEALKYRYKIDNEGWSVWSSDTSVKLYNIEQGEHTATACSRTKLLKVDPVCAEINFYK